MGRKQQTLRGSTITFRAKQNRKIRNDVRQQQPQPQQPQQQQQPHVETQVQQPEIPVVQQPTIDTSFEILTGKPATVEQRQCVVQ